jgi:uncharacterized phage protein gp47/JayE
MSDAVVDEFVSVRQDYIAAFKAGHLSSAAGNDLSKVAESYGVTRGRATRATVSAAHNNLTFYTSSGTFGDLNSAADINVPAGTIVASLPNGNELGATVRYKLTASAVLSAGRSSTSVSAIALDVGTGSNVGTNILTTHDFTNYTDYSNRTLKITNFYPIVNARDEDSDSLLKYKAANYYSTRQQINEAAYKLEALDVPGVIDSRVIPGYFGIGTAALVVLGAENRVDDSILGMCTARLSAMQAPGLDTIAIPAVKVTFDLVIDATSSKTILETQRQRIENQVRLAIRDYFRFASIGGFLDFTLLESKIKQSIEVPLTMRLAQNRNGMFRTAYCRKSYGQGEAEERKQILTLFYTLAEDEYPALGTLELNILSSK